MLRHHDHLWHSVHLQPCGQWEWYHLSPLLQFVVCLLISLTVTNMWKYCPHCYVLPLRSRSSVSDWAGLRASHCRTGASHPGLCSQVFHLRKNIGIPHIFLHRGNNATEVPENGLWYHCWDWHFGLFGMLRSFNLMSFPLSQAAVPHCCFSMEGTHWARAPHSCCEMWKLDLFPGEGDELKDVRKEEGRPNQSGPCSFLCSGPVASDTAAETPFGWWKP